MATEPAIGTSIKRARERKRWTQRQLAQELGVNIKTVDNWENGRTSPRNSIGALEAVLGVTFTEPGGSPPLVPADEWERLVLEDQALPYAERADIVRRSRALRARLYPALEPPPSAGDGREVPPESSRAG